MGNTRPYVQAAFICERVLREKDDVLTAVRIVDSFTIRGFPPEGLPSDSEPMQLRSQVLVSLKSGDLVGKYEVSFALRMPSGETQEVSSKWPVVFEGGEHGANLVLNHTLPVKQLGLFWLDVLWDNEVLTSIPIRVKAPEPPPKPE